MRILVVNTGSSSLKLTVLEETARIGHATVDRWDGADIDDPVATLLAAMGPVDAVGHRVVHGGPRHLRAARIDDALVQELAALNDLAPLHSPRAVAGINAMGRALPLTPAVAVFDTGYFTTMPAAATTYALPQSWNERFGLRRYGFHGLSHAYAVRRATELARRELADARVVSCHLGAGCSVAASRSGIAVDTTMGFTPLAGLVMKTRSGSIDPGLLLWLQQHGGVDLTELADALVHRSGLRGLSGTSGDIREVIRGLRDGDQACRLAFDVFTHRIVREVGAMAASAGGLDLLVFTGGVGEHSPEVRAAVTDRLRHLGVEVDRSTNSRADADMDISAANAPIRTVVVTAGEEVEIARETRRVLHDGGSQTGDA